MRRFAPLMFAVLCLAGCGRDPVGGEAADVVAAEQVTDLAAVPAGRAVYEEFCASCHDIGLEGAPVTGNAADWEDRSSLWQAVLMEHAKEGYLQMPARGDEPALTDLAVSQAVEYMLLATYPQKQPD